MSPLAIGTVVVTFLAWMTKTAVRTNQGQRVYFGCLRGLKPWQLGPVCMGRAPWHQKQLSDCLLLDSWELESKLTGRRQGKIQPSGDLLHPTTLPPPPFHCSPIMPGHFPSGSHLLIRSESS